MMLALVVFPSSSGASDTYDLSLLSDTEVAEIICHLEDVLIMNIDDDDRGLYSTHCHNEKK